MARRVNPKQAAPAYQWWAGEKLADLELKLLPLDAFGLFRLLYDYAWAENGLPINLDKIFGISRCKTRAEFRSLWKLVSPFFPRARDGRLRNMEQEEQRRGHKSFCESRVVAAKKSWTEEARIARAKRATARAEQVNARAEHVQSSASAPALALASKPYNPDQEQREKRADRTRTVNVALPESKRLKLLTKIAHCELDNDPNRDDGELMAVMKTQAARINLPYDGAIVGRALDMARAQRKSIGSSDRGQRPLRTM